MYSCLILDSQLPSSGCSLAQLEESAAVLDTIPSGPWDLEVKQKVRLACILLLRAVAKLQEAGPMEDVATAKPVFEKLWARATLYGDLVQIFNSSDRVHLSNMAGVIESVLAKVAALQCRDPTAKANLAFFGVSHRRYLSWLMQHLDRMRDTPEDVHMVALFLELLDFYPSWVQIAVAGAAQNLRGKGMLASAGTSKLLPKSVSIFPARREVELFQAVAALGLELPSSSEERITVIGRGGRATTPDDDLAARLVSTALREMGQEEYDSIC